MNQQTFKYDVFISYKHEPTDKKVAQYLQKALEQYKIPKEIQQKTGKKKIARVFRDEEELAVASDLSEEIEEQLRQTEFLLVVCSKKTKESIWVQREIQTFLKYRSRRYVLLVLVEGEPEEAFPKIILDGGEPLAADLRGNTDKEVLAAAQKSLPRIVAPILHCSYDELKQRHKAYQMKRIAWITGAIAAVSLLFGAYSIKQNIEIKENYTKKQENQSRYLAQTSKKLLESGDREAAMLVALAALPENEEDNSRPLVAEARMALENSLYLYREPLKSYILPYEKAAHPTELDDKPICYNGDTPYVMTKDGDGFLYVWNGETLESIGAWKEHPWRKALFSKNGMILADSGERYTKKEDDRLLFMDPVSGKVLWEKQPYTSDLYGYYWDYNENKDEVVLLQYDSTTDYTNPENSKVWVKITHISCYQGKETGWELEKQGERKPRYLSISPDGTKLAVLYYDSILMAEDAENELCIYDAQNGNLLFSREVNGWLDSSYAWLNEDLFAAGYSKAYSMGWSGDETEWKVEAYSISQGKVVWEYKDISLNLQDRMILEVMDVKDGNGKEETVVSVICNNLHVMLNRETGHCYNRMEAHNMIQNVIALDGKKQLLYFMQTGDVYLSGAYETYTFDPLWSYNYELGSQIISEVVKMDDIFYVTEGANLHTYKVAAEMNGVRLTEKESILKMEYSPEGKYFYSCVSDNQIFLYKSDSGEKIAQFTYYYGGGTSCFINENTLAYISGEGELVLYHIDEKKEQKIENVDLSYYQIRSLGKEKLLVWGNGQYYIFDGEGSPLYSFERKELKEVFGLPEDFYFQADEFIVTETERYALFIDRETGTLYAWDLAEEKPVNLPECADMLLAGQKQWGGFSKGFDRKCIRGDEIIFYGKDKMIRIYNLREGKITFQMETDGVGDQFVVFTPNGEHLVYINRVNQLRIVNRKTGEYTVAGLERLNQHGTAYFTFSKDGKELYVRSVEQISTPIMIFYEEEKPGVYMKQTEVSYCYGTNGEYMMIQDSGPLHLCKKYELDELIAFAKEKLDGRELTPEEKMEYLIDQ